MEAMEISGRFDPQFRRVAEAFENNFANGLELGAAFCLFQNGEKKVDIWGGYMDAARTRLWDEDTLVNVWSTTKGVLAFSVGRLVDQGHLELDQTVAHYWPAFGVNGKQDITVAQLFSHQAGICGPSRKITSEECVNTDFLAAYLADETPQWEPGTRSGYHAFTLGPLADGLFQRIIGKTVGAYFREEVAEPMGLDFHIGLPASEDHRVANLVHDGGLQAGGPDAWNEFQASAHGNIPTGVEIAMTRDWRAQGTPSAGGQGNARSVATLYNALATDRRLNGTEIISRAGLGAVTKIQIENTDLVIGLPVSWGAGYVINTSKLVCGPNPEAFGHSGWGGSFGFADPASGVAAAYTMNRMIEPLRTADPRVVALIKSIFTSLE